MEKKINEQELKSLQELNAEFNKMKSQLGDLALQQQSILTKVDVLRGDFSAVEADLTKKYGKDAIVNLETGVITKREDSKEETK